jgi:phosphoribosylformimino-5-aminoimidazole carboxamide ribotide isomerase
LDLYPAIDIRAGQAVRAPRASLEGAVLVHRDAIAFAERLAAEGATWLHVVDLERAFGVGDQTPLIAALVKRLAIPVQVAGGLRDADAVLALRDAGVQRALLDARVAAQPRVLAQLADQFAEDSLGLALDLEDGRAWGRHWPDARHHSPEALARAATEAGLRVIAVTDLGREGALAGPDVETAGRLARDAGADVLVSGGIRDLADLARIRDAGLAGAVVGRALDETRFTLREAIACCTSSSP